MKQLASAIDRIANFVGYLSAWLVPLMMMLVVVDVFMRYVMQQPLMIADEFSAYMLVALSFLGFAYTWRQGGHVRVEVVVNYLPPRLKSWVRLIGLILTFIFMIEMDRAAYKMIVYALQMKMRSSTWLMFPLFWPQLTIFVGFVLFTLMLAVDIVQAGGKLRAGKNAEA
ncbi:MAG: TRAP transporter small permease [candidate division NC10 bacterium]